MRLWLGMQVLGMLDLPAADLELLTTQEDKARIHVVFMGQGLLPDALEKRMNASGNWARVVAFRPTGTAPRIHFSACLAVSCPLSSQFKMI